VPIDPETYDLIQSGEEPGRALSEQETKDLEQNGRILDKQAGRVVSVLPSQDPGAFRWNPGDLRIPISDLREQYDPLTFAIFEAEMKSTPLAGGKTVWDWLND
jgi:hypothetical protein